MSPTNSGFSPTPWGWTGIDGRSTSEVPQALILRIPEYIQLLTLTILGLEISEEVALKKHIQNPHFAEILKEKLSMARTNEAVFADILTKTVAYFASEIGAVLPEGKQISEFEQCLVRLMFVSMRQSIIERKKLLAELNRGGEEIQVVMAVINWLHVISRAFISHTLTREESNPQEGFIRRWITGIYTTAVQYYIDYAPPDNTDSIS